jgi:hypothetical protein
VGGFWEPADGVIHGKGDLIAGEVYLSVAMRAHGHGIQFTRFPLHHYGTARAMTETDATLNAFDTQRGFPLF